MSELGSDTADVPLAVIFTLARVPCRSLRSTDLSDVKDLKESLRRHFDPLFPMRLAFDSDSELSSFARGEYASVACEIYDGAHRKCLLRELVDEAKSGDTSWFCHDDATIRCVLRVIERGHARIEAALAANAVAHAVIRSGWLDALLLLHELVPTIPDGANVTTFITEKCPNLLRVCGNLRRTITVFNRVEAINAWEAIRYSVVMCGDQSPLCQTFWQSGPATSVLDAFLASRDKLLSSDDISRAYVALINTNVAPMEFMRRVRMCGIPDFTRLVSRMQARQQLSVVLAAVVLSIAFKRYERVEIVPSAALFSDETIEMDQWGLEQVIADLKSKASPLVKGSRSCFAADGVGKVHADDDAADAAAAFTTRSVAASVPAVEEAAPEAPELPSSAESKSEEVMQEGPQPDRSDDGPHDARPPVDVPAAVVGDERKSESDADSMQDADPQAAAGHEPKKVDDNSSTSADEEAEATGEPNEVINQDLTQTDEMLVAAAGPRAARRGRVRPSGGAAVRHASVRKVRRCNRDAKASCDAVADAHRAGRRDIRDRPGCHS